MDLPGRGSRFSGDDVAEGGFPCAIWANDNPQFTVFDAEGIDVECFKAVEYRGGFFKEK